MKFALAKSYLQADRKSDAQRQLEEEVQLPLTSLRTNENPRVQVQARRLPAKLGWK